METLNEQFAQAVRNVTISGTKRALAIAAHTEVRLLLETDLTLRGWGVDSILIGSYARQTARYPGKDVDVFLRLMKLSVHYDPEKVYDAVANVLITRYGLKDRDPGGRVTLQARSVKIDFADPDDDQSDNSFSIDAVPAVPWGDHWGIPNRDRDLWSNEDKRWVKTNPVQFAADTDTLSTAPESPTVDSTNAYRPIVRLLRQVRHEHFGKERPGGLYTEVAAYHVWHAHLVTGGTWAELLASTLEQVAHHFAACENSGVIDPVLGTPMKPALEPWQWTTASQGLARLAEQARQALASDRCRAAALWRAILGTNERGQVLPLPHGCDAAGFPIGAITPVSAVGSNQPRGFADLPSPSYARN